MPVLPRKRRLPDWPSFVFKDKLFYSCKGCRIPMWLSKCCPSCAEVAHRSLLTLHLFLNALLLELILPFCYKSLTIPYIDTSKGQKKKSLALPLICIHSCITVNDKSSPKSICVHWTELHQYNTNWKIRHSFFLISHTLLSFVGSYVIVSRVAIKSSTKCFHSTKNLM